MGMFFILNYSHFLKRLHGGGLWGRGGLLHWGPWKISYESFQIQASLSMWAPFHPGTLIDECRRALVVGHLSARDSIKGTLREGSFTGEPE